MSSEIHEKLLAFLAGALSRGGNEAAMKLQLEYKPKNGYRAETLKQYTRESDPELFILGMVTGPRGGDDADASAQTTNMAFVEAATAEMIDLAESHADGYGEGRHRFVVRVIQHYGTRLTHSFAVLPSFDSEDADADRSLVIAGEGSGASGGGQITAQPNATGIIGQLMRHLEQRDRHQEKMLGQFLGAMTNQAAVLREENSSLRDQLAAKDQQFVEWRKQIEEAQSLEHERQIEARVVDAREERKTMATKKITGLLPVLISKMSTPSGPTGGDGKAGASGASADQSPLAQVIQRLLISLSKEQQAMLMTVLAMEQQVILFEVGRVIKEAGDSPLVATMVYELSTTLSETQLTQILAAFDDVQRALFVRAIQMSNVAATAGQRKPTPAQPPQANGTHTDAATPKES
jgi:hypothetical protein